MERMHPAKAAVVVLPTAFAVGLGIGAVANESTPSEDRGPEFKAADTYDYYQESDVLSDVHAEVEETPTPSAMPSPSALPEIIFTPTPTPTVESTPTPEPTPEATPESTPTPTPTPAIEIETMSDASCALAEDLGYAFNPSEEGLDDVQTEEIEELYEAYEDQVNADAASGRYEDEVISDAYEIAKAVAKVLKFGQRYEDDAEHTIAMVMDENCPNNEILS